MPLDLANARTAEDRVSVLEKADELLAANDNSPAKPRLRSRAGRPALNWLRRQDERAAAALWLVARRHLAEDAANDNRADAKGMGLDRRKHGKARGKNNDPRSLDAYLALPGEQPRLGDPEPATGPLRGWWSDTIALKPQDWIHPDAEFTEATRFSWHPPAIAYGAIFLGAIGGLGQLKAGKSLGDVRRVDEPDLPSMPDRVAATVEAMLARADLAGVGRALGYRGGYADRQGRKAMLEAGRWALTVATA